jgi:aminoglycoside 6'-N-acetyltransferase
VFTFTPLRPADLARIRGWLQQPHVRAWWGDPKRGLEEIRQLMSADWVEAMLVSWQGRQIGYLQAYDGSAVPEPGWPETMVAPGTFGIDTFIGEPGYVGRGLGPAFIGAYTDRLLTAARATRIVTDPHPTNHRAIRCYEKAGFAAIGEAATPDGPALLMEKLAPR